MRELIPELVAKVISRDDKSHPLYEGVLRQAKTLKDFDGEAAQKVFEGLIHAMDDMAPPHFYFGPVHGGYDYIRE